MTGDLDFGVEVEPEPLADLLARYDIDPESEAPFPNDGWSGAALTRLRSPDGASFILKRDSFRRDWIMQATADIRRRESWLALRALSLPWPVRFPALGAAWTLEPDSTSEPDEIAILMPDLSGVLFDWNRPLNSDELAVVLSAMASLHGAAEGKVAKFAAWTPWEERLTLISRRSLERRGPAREAVGSRILPGWDAWDRFATPVARAIVEQLSDNDEPLLDALVGLPSTLIHGDLKLANIGIAADGAVEMIDWQMVTVAPVAIELGWFLVSNVNALPFRPEEILDRYWALREVPDGQRLVENDLAILVGLLLRGWRKGYDAAAGIKLASGVAASDDLAWWCERAVEAADRLL
jgi:Phosphotransferase enzyme family